MRLNLYTAATCSFLAYGIEAINLASSATDANCYMDEYEYDLAQTYSDLHEGDNSKKKSEKETVKEKMEDGGDSKKHDKITKCAKIPKTAELKVKVPSECDESCSGSPLSDEYDLNYHSLGCGHSCYHSH